MLSRRLVHAINLVNNSWAKHLPATKRKQCARYLAIFHLSHNSDYISPETVIGMNVGTEFVRTIGKTTLNLQRHSDW